MSVDNNEMTFTSKERKCYTITSWYRATHVLNSKTGEIAKVNYCGISNLYHFEMGKAKATFNEDAADLVNVIPVKEIIQ